MHDEALMIQWNRRGDADAFRTLTQRYGRMVYASALRVLGNASDAEDVTQDCFEKLARANKAPRGYLGPWLHRVAVNGALDRVRRDTARKRRESAYETARTVPHELEWDDIYPLVDEAINQLPDKLRRAIVAHYLEGLTHEEISKRESVTRAAITQRIQRALGQMRTTLQRKGVAVPGVAVLAGTIGSRLTEAAAVPASLTDKLGRIALAGPVVGKVGAVVGILSLPKVLGGVMAILTVAAGGLLWLQRPGPVSEPPTVVEAASPAQDSLGTEQPAAPSKNEPKSLAEAVTAALSTSGQGDTATVSGRVIDKVSGEGIAGAELSCRAGEQRLTATTDESGMYTFQSLPTGESRVLCRSANGYYLAHEKYKGVPSPMWRVLQLEPGQYYDDIDFALEKGLAYTGRVVDSNGSPIAGATISGYAEPDNFRIVNTAVSELDGTFTVSGFPETVEFTLWGEKNDLVSELYGPFILPQKEGATTDVVLWPDAIIRGTLVDRAGNPLEGLKVVPQFVPDVSAREIDTVSDGNGHFELKGMPPGIALLRVCKDVEIVNSPCPSYTLTAGEILDNEVIECSVGNQTIAGVVVDERGNPMSAEVSCDVPGGSNTRTRANGAGMFILDGLEPGTYTITARDWGRHIPGEPVEAKTGDSTVRIVMHDPIPVSGRVVDASSGTPITDFEIKDCFSPRLIIHDQRYTRVQNPDGEFELNVVQAGDVRIAARADGYLLGFTDVDLSIGQEPLGEVEIRLKPQEDLHGSVVDADGQAVSGALIFSGRVQESDADDFASARTHKDGTFVLPAGKLLDDVLTVFHPDYPKTTFVVQPAHRSGQPMEIRIADACALECTVLADGVPRNGASVWASPDPGNAQPSEGHAVTGQDGTCTIRGLTPGLYEVGATLGPQKPPLLSNVKAQVELAEGGGQSVIIEYHTGTASLEGKILGGVRALSLWLEMPTANAVQRYIFIQEQNSPVPDTFAFQNLPAGTGTLYVQWAMGNEGYHVEQVVTLQPGAAVVHDLDLDALAAEYIPDSTTR